MTATTTDGRANLDALHHAAQAHGDEVRDYLMGILACRVDPGVWAESLAEATRGRVSSRQCGQRAVVYDAVGSGGHLSGSCVESKDHGPDHRDADGHTWTESVR